MAWARHGHGMGSVNQPRSHCVNQMGKTHSKPLAARHGRGTAWTRHAICESALRQVGDVRLLSTEQDTQKRDFALCNWIWGWKTQGTNILYVKHPRWCCTQMFNHVFNNIQLTLGSNVYCLATWFRIIYLRKRVVFDWKGGYIPYILESNPHPFYSFRGLKNQMRIRFAVESWILENR